MPPDAAPPIEPQGQNGGVRRSRLQLRTFDALRYRDFRVLWFGQACVSMGVWMDQVARSWLLYELTNSPLQLGLLRGLQAIPLLLLSPVAGTAADRYDRKLQIIVAQTVDAAIYAVLAVLILSGLIQSWHVYVSAFVGGVVQTFQNPARMGMVAESVPADKLTNAIALNSVVFNMCRSTGPAIAGVLIATFGTWSAYLGLAGLLAAATLWTIVVPDHLRFPAGTGGGGRHHHGGGSFTRSTVDGWRVSWGNPAVRAGLLVTSFAALFILPFTTLLPVYARDILEVGSQGQGLLLTGMGIGAFCSAVMIASFGDQLPRGIFMLVGVTLYGLSVVAFSASPWFPLSVVLMVLVGSFHVSSHALVQTVIQTYTESEYRGRTMAIFQQSHVIMQLGAMLLGILATVFGAQHAMAAMAAIGALSAVGIALLVPAARRVR